MRNLMGLKPYLLGVAALLSSTAVFGQSFPREPVIPPIIRPRPIPIPPLLFPDLVVESISVRGTPRQVDNTYRVPILVTVKNQGGAAAGTFKVSINYTSGSNSFVGPFTVPGQSSIWYPQSSGSLAAGASVTFRGTLTVRTTGRTTLTALADSCSGDEFMPSYCRVRELNESNNSRSTGVSLP